MEECILINDDPKNKANLKLDQILILKYNVSGIIRKIFRLAMTLILISYLIFLCIFLQINTFEYLTKYYSSWAYLFTLSYFLIFSMQNHKKNFITISFFAHLVLCINALIFLTFWIFLQFYLSEFNNLKLFEKIDLFFINNFPFICTLIDFYLSKNFFLNKTKNLFRLLGIFLLYTFVNVFYVTVFGIVPYKFIKWDRYLDFVTLFCVFSSNLVFWYLFLFSQRLKFSIKNTDQLRKIRTHFGFLKDSN